MTFCQLQILHGEFVLSQNFKQGQWIDTTTNDLQLLEMSVEAWIDTPEASLQSIETRGFLCDILKGDSAFMRYPAADHERLERFLFGGYTVEDIFVDLVPQLSRQAEQSESRMLFLPWKTNRGRSLD